MRKSGSSDYLFHLSEEEVKQAIVLYLAEVEKEPLVDEVTFTQDESPDRKITGATARRRVKWEQSE